MIKIEKNLKGFYIEDDEVLDENVVFISEEEEGTICKQLGYIYDELYMIHRLKFKKMSCKNGKCNFNKIQDIKRKRSLIWK